ncbi:hypothetical protein [Pontibacter cellulosilyticus]|uniref:Uncharacterized protein n=1 Tax=Pontibacter cellulosilyticus TaxID=1720253 RepID=A0A923NC23_9BACT|nr:hypothetical protein [Pontibacter cellulosilyticus]MBC5994175.1 hypothetical protein [Pontibacter cellulosilyticus]
MKKYRYLLVAVVICLAMGFQCGDDYPPDPEPANIYKETLSLTPFQKSYNLGDTIWIETNLNNKFLFDSKSKQTALVDSVSLPVELSYSALYQVYSQPADGFCKVVSSNQVKAETKNYERTTFIIASYGCNQSGYRFKIGLVLLSTGVYSLRIAENTDFYNCLKPQQYANRSQISYTFDLNDTNKDVFLAIPAISRGGLNTEKIDSKEEYIVKVVK